jgi:hypothetical protein
LAVFSEPADDRAAARPGGEPFRCGGQHGVAGGVPAAVVDLLEVVQVDKDDSHRVGVAVDELAGLGGVAVTAAAARSGVTASRSQSPVQRHGVDSPAGQRNRQRGEEQGALPGTGL